MSYELIPYYTIGSYKIADPIVQIRLLYLFIWETIITQKLYGLHYNEFKSIIKETIKILDYFKQKINIYEINT